MAGAVIPLVGGGMISAADLMAKNLMQSAVKPTIKQLKTGDSAIAIQELLDRGISPNAAGVEKLRGVIGETNQQIKQAIAGSTADVSKRQAAMPLLDTLRQYSKQVSPASDLDAIRKTGLEFLSHPSYSGSTIPVQAAQELKQGTYKILAKKYGQVGTADTEAQKAIARGLKDEIAAAVPAVQGLNAQESRLLKTLDVAERRALMELNKNPMGLSLLSGSPAAWAAFMADRSAAFKALAARMLYRTGQGAEAALPAAVRGTGAIVAED
jgi:hypothetical protein